MARGQRIQTALLGAEVKMRHPRHEEGEWMRPDWSGRSGTIVTVYIDGASDVAYQVVDDEDGRLWEGVYAHAIRVVSLKS